jgi:hypothetical protein
VKVVAGSEKRTQTAETIFRGADDRLLLLAPGNKERFAFIKLCGIEADARAGQEASQRTLYIVARMLSLFRRSGFFEIGKFVELGPGLFTALARGSRKNLHQRLVRMSAALPRIPDRNGHRAHGTDDDRYNDNFGGPDD